MNRITIRLCSDNGDKGNLMFSSTGQSNTLLT